MQKLALVVDDSRVARMTLSKLLTAHGMDIFEVGSGEEALSYLHSNEQKPDIIFMDVMMGGIDGLSATQQLKADTNFSHIPVVICTGNDTQTDKDKALLAGASDVLTKPPVEHDLANILGKVQSVESVGVAQEIAPPTMDEDALVARIVNKVEQELLPRIQQSAREMAEDISRQIAEETAEKSAKLHAQTIVESMTPDLANQVVDQARKIVEETANRECKSAARDAVAKMADYAVQDALAKTDISTLISSSLESEGQAWLELQEQQLQLSVKSDSIAYVQGQVPQIATPIVHEMMEQKLAAAAEIENNAADELEVEEQQDDTIVESIPENIDKAMKALAERISLLNYMVVALGVVALIGIGIL